jgi:hypothetical protein
VMCGSRCSRRVTVRDQDALVNEIGLAVRRLEQRSGSKNLGPAVVQFDSLPPLPITAQTSDAIRRKARKGKAGTRSSKSEHLGVCIDQPVDARNGGRARRRGARCNESCRSRIS